MQESKQTLMPVAEALARLLDSARPFRAVREISLADCQGQYLAEAVTSRVDVPAFDNAAVDGVALRHADLDEPGLTRPMPCLLYTSPSPRDLSTARMPSSA